MTANGLAAEPARFQLSRWLFLRLVGVTYLLAFASLAPQLIGLVGEGGLLPVGQYLERAPPQSPLLSITLSANTR